MDMRKDIDFVKVEDGERADFKTYNLGLPPSNYRILNVKSFEPILVSMYWPNGNLITSIKYEFNYLLYAMAEAGGWGNRYSKLLYPSKYNEIVVYHYNGEIAYKGELVEGKMCNKGKYYDIKGSETDSSSFTMSSLNAGKYIQGSELDFDLQDKIYKNFRGYFDVVFRK